MALEAKWQALRLKLRNAALNMQPVSNSVRLMTYYEIGEPCHFAMQLLRVVAGTPPNWLHVALSCAAERLWHKAQDSESARNWQQAYIVYLRYATLVMKQLPTVRFPLLQPGCPCPPALAAHSLAPTPPPIGDHLRTMVPCADPQHNQFGTKVYQRDQSTARKRATLAIDKIKFVTEKMKVCPPGDRLLLLRSRFDRFVCLRPLPRCQPAESPLPGVRVSAPSAHPLRVLHHRSI